MLKVYRYSDDDIDAQIFISDDILALTDLAMSYSEEPEDLFQRLHWRDLLQQAIRQHGIACLRIYNSHQKPDDKIIDVVRCRDLAREAEEIIDSGGTEQRLH